MSSEVNRWEIRKVRLDDCIPSPENPRTITDSSKAALELSIDRFGYVEPIVWNETTRHIVGGHKRFEVLKERKVVEAMMVVVQLAPEDELAANLTLNNPKIEGTWDESAVGLMNGLQMANEQLTHALRIDRLKESLERRIKPEEDGGIEVNEDPETDTECPCCKHKWSIQEGDVSLEDGT